MVQSKEIKENTTRLYQDKTKTAISAFDKFWSKLPKISFQEWEKSSGVVKTQLPPSIEIFSSICQYPTIVSLKLFDNP